jgi:hypothetical protein
VHRRPRRLGDRAERPDGHGERPPPEHVESLLGSQLADQGPGLGGLVLVPGQEGDAGGVPAALGEGEVDDLPVEGVGDLDEDAGAVAAVLLAAGGTPVGQVLEGADGPEDEGVGRPSLQVGDEGHPAGVVLEPGVVEAGRGGVGDTAGAGGEADGDGDGPRWRRTALG